MKSVKIAVLIFLLPLLAFTTSHKYYVSVTQIEYVKEKQTVQIISRIFIDDFEALLRNRYDETITLNNTKDELHIEAYIKKYLKQKLQIKINDTIKSLIFIGKEYEEDIIYCYLEIENVTNITSFEISNQLMFDLFNEQQNIIKTNINSKKKSFVLISQKDTKVLNFR